MALNHSLIREIAGKLFTLQAPRVDPERETMARDCLEYLAREFLPQGSGFDCGTRVDVDKSRPDRIVFFTEFHHMNDVGYYDGWTQHNVIVTPSFIGGMNIRVTGRNKRLIKEYIEGEFDYLLKREISVSFDIESREYSYAWAAA